MTKYSKEQEEYDDTGIEEEIRINHGYTEEEWKEARKDFGFEDVSVSGPPADSTIPANFLEDEKEAEEVVECPRCEAKLWNKDDLKDHLLTVHNATEFKPELQGKKVRITGGDLAGQTGTVTSVGVFSDSVTVDVNGNRYELVKEGDYEVIGESNAYESMSWEYLPRDFKKNLSEGLTPVSEVDWNTSNKTQKRKMLKEAGLYGYGSATGRMSPAEDWNQGGTMYGERNPMFDEFRGLKWSELPKDIQDAWKVHRGYAPYGQENEKDEQEVALLTQLLNNELEEEAEGEDETEDIALIAQLLDIEKDEIATEADFKEEEHPRDEGGQFTSKGAGKKAPKEKKQKPTKNLNKVKDKILKAMGEPKDEWDRKKYNKISNLDGYPQHSSQLKNVGVRYKAPIMKSHLKDAYPDSNWSVRTEYFSGGSAIRAGWKGGDGYPYGADKIRNLYSDSGATDIQVDYFDTDNYVDLYDLRDDKPYYDHGQHIYNSREERFGAWVAGKLNELNQYDSATQWSQEIGKNFVEGKTDVNYQGIDDKTMDEIKELWQEFKEQEKKEGGVAEPQDVPQATTPASYEKPLTLQKGGDPPEIPIDPKTREELPVSGYNPLKGKSTISDPTKETPADVDRAHQQMLAQKAELDRPEGAGGTFDRRGQPWQRGGESNKKKASVEFEDSDRPVSPNTLQRYSEPIDLPTGKNALDQTYGMTEPEANGQDLTGKTVGADEDLMDLSDLTPEELEELAYSEKPEDPYYKGEEDIIEKEPPKIKYHYFKQYPYGRTPKGFFGNEEVPKTFQTFNSLVGSTTNSKNASVVSPSKQLSGEDVVGDIWEKIQGSGISYGYNRDELYKYLKSLGYYDEEIEEAFNRYYGESYSKEQVSLDTMNKARVWWDNRYPDRPWSDLRIGERQKAILAFLRDPSTSLEGGPGSGRNKEWASQKRPDIGHIGWKNYGIDDYIRQAEKEYEEKQKAKEEELETVKDILYPEEKIEENNRCPEGRAFDPETAKCEPTELTPLTDYPRAEEGGKGSGRKGHRQWMTAVEEDPIYEKCPYCKVITEQINSKCQLCGNKIKATENLEKEEIENLSQSLYEKKWDELEEWQKDNIRSLSSSLQA